MSARPNAPFKAPRLMKNVSQAGGNPIVSLNRPTIKRSLPRQTLGSNAANSAPLVKKSRPSTPTSSTVEKYIVQWRKKTTKKNKTWDGDGQATIYHLGNGGCEISVKNSDNKSLGKGTFTVLPDFDEVISLGTYEIELDEKLSGESHESSQELAPKPVLKRVSPVPTTSMNVTHQFKKVTPVTYTEQPHSRKAMYDDNNNNAIALPPPPDTTNFVKVSIDPLLATKLRPHQIEGVSFLYECLMGYRSFDGKGCLLADEMGLGKTLMTITTIWTLLKQNPFPDQKKSVVNKVLVVCPATLISNWRQEFRKWLGPNKLNVLTLNNSMSNEKQDILNFGKLNVYQVLVINYEKITIHYEELSTIKFDLLVCDEGHRLKNNASKVLNNLIKMDIPRKIVLTGTPIQNELIEFHTLISFLNPGVLPDLKTFQKNYVNPISRARDVNCFDPEVKRKGDEISQLLIKLTLQFILRRTQAILAQYLTSKTDVLLFVPPTTLQLNLFRYITNLRKFDQIIRGTDSLKLINLFKKICNSPSLLSSDSFFQQIVEENFKLELSSGKINVLIPLLMEIAGQGEKVVLISNYTKTLNLLETILHKINLTFSRLDGSTSTKDRSHIVKQFNTNPKINVFLLSSKSGGMGINLVGASRLILFDNDWNPATDLQSMSRIHRDGQEKPCFIYRIFTTGCFDEKIFQRQLVKNELSSKFLDNDSTAKSDMFDDSDLKNIFEVHEDTISNTHDLLECSCKGDGATLDPPPSHSQSQSQLKTDDGGEDTPPPYATQAWVSALELQKKMGENEDVLKKSAVKSALSNYQHYNPGINKNLPFDIVLHRITNNNTFRSKKLPITFIMLKVTNQQD